MQQPDQKTKLLADIRRKQEKLSKMASLVESMDAEDIVFFLASLGAPLAVEPSLPVTVLPESSKPRLDTNLSFGRLESALRSAISSMDVFTSPGLVSVLEQEGFQFTAKNRLAAVNQVLRKLRDSGFIVEIEPGGGRRAAKYRKKQSGQQEVFSMAS